MRTTRTDILLVDGDPAHAARVTEAVAPLDASMQTATSLAEARRALSLHRREGGARIVLIEPGLPDGDGMVLAAEALDRPKAERPDVVLVPAVADQADRLRGLTLGVLDYLPDPLDGAALRARMASVLRTDADEGATAPVRMRTDDVTGLPNRVAFCDAVLEATHQDGQTPSDRPANYAALLVNLERFRLLNEGLGHETGDALLRAVAGRLRRSLREADETTGRPGDLLARIGGGEFAVLLRGLDHAQNAEAVAARIVRELAMPLLLNGQELVVGCSVGIKIGDGPVRDADELLNDGAAAASAARRRGRGGVVVFDDAMKHQAGDRLKLEQALRQGLREEQFNAVYQPYVDLESGWVTGFEALARWCHPTLGTVRPDQFVAVAEETDLIIELGEWMLRQAMRQQAEWARACPGRSLTVGVNLSKKQICHPQLLASVDRVLDDLGVDPSGVKLEVTESVIMHDASRVVPVLDALRDRGFPLAMDDFGVGESSLASLHAFPVDVLKIDQAFIKNLDGQRGYAAIVNAIVSLAHHLDMSVIAEGIETPGQVAELLAMDCDWGQGYLFAPPVPVCKATALLARPFGPEAMGA